MRLSDILQCECIKVPLAATSKQEAIFELVDLLADGVGIGDHDALKQAVWQRETTRTTGIGHGIGIPHGKSSQVAELHLAIGKPAQPIDFDAIDRKPVDLLFLLVSPEDKTGPHIQALAQISKILTDADFRSQLKQAGTAAQLLQMICDYESQMVKA